MAFERGKLSLMAGTVAPVEKAPWDDARRKLDQAAIALSVMKVACDRNSYEDAWTTFVDSLQVFWHRFYDEGKATFNGFTVWVAELDTQRKNDELLKYLSMARNQNQHGRLSLDWGAQVLRVGPPGFSGNIGNIAIFADGRFEVNVKRDAGSAEVPALALDPGAPSVPTVINRGTSFPPPELHLGLAIGSGHPLAIANRGWGWHSKVLCDAFDVFVGRPGTRQQFSI